MIIVSGRIMTKSAKRDAFLASSNDAIVAARKARGCRDFIVAADPIEADRVNVHEEWESVADLEAFKGDGPDDEMTDLIEKAKVQRHVIALSSPG